MISKQLKILKPALGLLLGASISTSALAQGNLEDEYPELARLYDAFTVTHAAALDKITELNANPQLSQARAELAEHLAEMQEMDHMAMMGHGGHGEMMDHSAMSMDGPYGELEAQARAELGRMVRARHTDAAAAEAYGNAASLPTHAAMVLAWGRQFEENLADIWADPDLSVDAKVRATGTAIEDYQTGDEMHAISVRPKPAALYLEHEYAGGLQTAFPRISGLLWSNQWLRLASMEAIIVGEVDPQFAGRVVITLERYNNKLGSDTGMSMFPPPVEMPTVPAITPTLYTMSPQASIIVDNLNMLEAAIADIVAYPDLDADTREQAILEKVEQFTAEGNAADDMNYLLSALRGGIYNQGGPAVGQLMGSERNRSREAMGMQHSMIMSAPN